MNVLLTCAGRRNFLAESFLVALKGKGKLLAADSRTDAPVLEQADTAFKVPPIDDPGYCQRLLEICSQEEVALLVPLNDLELPLLAAECERFKEIGTRVLVSSPRVVELCFDKWATALFLQQHGISAPRTYLDLAEAYEALERGELKFPVVLKPRWGSASIGVELAFDWGELEEGYRLARKRLGRTILAAAARVEHNVLIQETLEGEEIGLDVINDLSGRYCTTFARLKLGMRAGETDRALTVESERLGELGARLGNALGHIGILDCDVFMSGGECRVLEMNPRFGGGYPFSHAAGADVPSALLAWLEGVAAAPEWLRMAPGVLGAKCDRLVVIQ